MKDNDTSWNWLDWLVKRMTNCTWGTTAADSTKADWFNKAVFVCWRLKVAVCKITLVMSLKMWQEKKSFRGWLAPASSITIHGENAFEQGTTNPILLPGAAPAHYYGYIYTFCYQCVKCSSQVPACVKTCWFIKDSSFIWAQKASYTVREAWAPLNMLTDLKASLPS